MNTQTKELPCLRVAGRAMAICSLCLTVVTPTISSAAEAKSASLEVRSLLRFVDTATRNVDSAAYVAEIRRGERTNATVLKVKVQRLRTDERIGGRLSFIHDDLTITYDGENMYRLTAVGARLLPWENGQPFLDAAQDAWIHFVNRTPFQDELDAPVAKIEGDATTDGISCNVVYVEYVSGSKARWHFGKKDGLPRRVDRLNVKTGQTVESTTLKGLRTGAAFNRDEFTLKVTQPATPPTASAKGGPGFSETAAKHLGRIYFLTNPVWQEDFVSYLKQHRAYFGEQGESIRLAKILGQRFTAAGLKSFDKNAYERALRTGGPADLAGEVGRSFNKTALELSTLGEELLWLVEVLPRALEGDLNPYLSTGTETRRYICQIVPILDALFAIDPDAKQIFYQAMQALGPASEETILMHTRMLNAQISPGK